MPTLLPREEVWYAVTSDAPVTGTPGAGGGFLFPNPPPMSWLRPVLYAGGDRQVWAVIVEAEIVIDSTNVVYGGHLLYPIDPADATFETSPDPLVYLDAFGLNFGGDAPDPIFTSLDGPLTATVLYDPPPAGTPESGGGYKWPSTFGVDGTWRVHRYEIWFVPTWARAHAFFTWLDAGGFTVDLDASTSFSNESSITEYQWDFGDGNTGTSSFPTTTHTYIDGLTYHDVTLTLIEDGAPGYVIPEHITRSTAVTEEGSKVLGGWGLGLTITGSGGGFHV